MASTAPNSRNHADYTIVCICPMGVELAPVQAMLDEVYPSLPTQRDYNSYILGKMKGHNIVIAVLPETWTNSAASVATQLLNDFSEIRFGLLVGIGGGVPDEEENLPDIRLGDVVISKSTDTYGGVVQYDLGKDVAGIGFQRTGTFNKPPMILGSSVEKLRADHRVNGSQIPSLLNEMLQKHPAMRDEYSHPGMGTDILFSKDYIHERGKTCLKCNKEFAVERDE